MSDSFWGSDDFISPEGEGLTAGMPLTVLTSGKAADRLGLATDDT
jgi:hypothetical protein